ncbi:MAG: GspH/FimT family pseudopilin [Pseudomonadota bacterium]|nr:GspH/FimT family pseudopilin [Pseudomonadota bacterium]
MHPTITLPRALSRAVRRRRACSGVTLVELTIAITVMALLLACSVPAYVQWMAELKLRNAAHALADSLAVARSEAIKHGGRATLCKSADRRRCKTNGGWQAGWILFLDDNHNGQADPDEVVTRVEPPADQGITTIGNQPLADYVSFTALGHARLLSGALQIGTFTVCRTGLRAYHVVLASTGRVRVERVPDVCL